MGYNPRGTAAGMAGRRSCVYRLYDADEELLYVGISTNPEGRIYAHRRKPWGDQIASRTVEWFPSRLAAQVAEASAIHHEQPIHNITRPRLECC